MEGEVLGIIYSGPLAHSLFFYWDDCLIYILSNISAFNDNNGGTTPKKTYRLPSTNVNMSNVYHSYL